MTTHRNAVRSTERPRTATPTRPEPEPEPMLTTEQVAKLLTVDPSTVRRLIDAGTLPATRVGRQYRVERAELRAFLTRQRTSEPLVVQA